MDIEEFKRKERIIEDENEKKVLYEEFFSQINFKIGNQNDFYEYDAFLKMYIEFCEKSGIEFQLATGIINGFKILESNLPKDKNISDAMSYNYIINKDIDMEVHDKIFPNRTYEKLREQLLGKSSDMLDNDGNIIQFKKYDSILQEYIRIFGNSETYSSDVLNALKKIFNYRNNLDLERTYSYSYERIENLYEKALEQENNNDILYIVNNLRYEITLDVLKRMYEADNKISLTKLEEDIVSQMLFQKDENGQSEIARSISALLINPSVDIKNLVKYIIRNKRNKIRN